jgi:predicted Fe-S protein YdhL (DUF1289 family)
MAAASSPCINICIVDPPSGLCQGCGRTLDEIAAWAALGEGERLAIMATLPARLARSRQERMASAGRSNPRRRRPEPGLRDV